MTLKSQPFHPATATTYGKGDPKDENLSQRTLASLPPENKATDVTSRDRKQREEPKCQQIQNALPPLANFHPATPATPSTKSVSQAPEYYFRKIVPPSV